VYTLILLQTNCPGAGPEIIPVRAGRNIVRSLSSSSTSSDCVIDQKHDNRADHSYD